MFKAKHYDKIYPDRKKEIDFLLKHLKGKTVFDIGGGTGIISKALEKKGFECCNIEPQREMAEISYKRGINTFWKTIEDFKIDTKFDNAIMVFDVFNFLTDPEKALENIANLLEKKGRLIFSYWNAEIKKSGWEFDWKLKRLSHKKWFGNIVKIDFWFPFFHEKHIMRVYPDEEIYKFLGRTGFTTKEKFENKFTKTIIAEI